MRCHMWRLKARRRERRDENERAMRSQGKQKLGERHYRSK